MAIGDWTTGYNATPDGAVDLGSTLDEQLQTLKTLIQERASLELDWGTSSFEAGYSDTGRSNPGSARAYVQTSSPTGLRRPDNSANQTGTTLTKAADQGRLWVDTDDNNRLRVIDPDISGTGASWRPVAAAPAHDDGYGPPLAGTSTATTTIPSGSTVDLALAGSITAPAEASTDWDLFVSAYIHVINGAGSDRTVRLDLVETTTATIIDVAEVTLKSGEVQRIPLQGYLGMSASTTYGFKVVGEASGANVAFHGGSGGTHLTGNGAANRTHCIVVTSFYRPS